MPVLPWGTAKLFLKGIIKITYVRKTAAQADIENFSVSRCQKVTGVLETFLVQVFLEGHPQRIFKKVR